MAAFGDSNDIKINVTLDTEDAVKAAQDLKTAIENSLKATETQFQKLQQLSKGLSSALVEQSKAAGQVQVANTKQVLDQTVAANAAAADKAVKITEEAAAKKVRAEQKAQAQILEAQKVAARQAETAAREAAEKEKTRRTQLLKDIAQLNKDRAIIRKTPRAELPADLGGVSSSGKLLKELEGIAVSVGNRFGFLTVNASQAFRILSGFGALGGVFAGVAGGVAGLQIALGKANAELLATAQQAGRLEGLKTGFETLQKSVGSDAVRSLEALRKSTQGLISDTELYQKANQAVLLNVPTEVFNEAAGAAVKLGRAMGIDAGFALESLSLGLGRQSRLYLDNLGIVVSAEEAYQKFAIANDIVGRSLTDSEKRAAFYAESLQKIKERAQELPDILDSVGVASQKVAVAQENVNSAYLNGFNSSFELAKAFKEQAEITQSTSATSELFGRQVAKIGAGLVESYNSIKIFNSGLKEMAVGFLDIFVRASPEKQLEDLNKQIQRSQEIIRKNAEEIGLFGTALGDSYTNIRTNIIQKAAEDIREAQAKIRELGLTIQEVRDQSNTPIKIKVDLTEVFQAQAAFKGLIADLRANILEQGGTFEVPGISAQALQSAGDAVEALTLKVLESKGQFSGFDAEFKKIQDSLAFDIQKEKVGQLNTELAQLRKEQSQIGDTSSAAYKKNIQAIGEAEAKLKEYNNQAGLSVEAEKAAKKALESRVQGAKKKYDELIAKQKQQAREAAAAAKKQSDEWSSFLKQLNRGLSTGLEPEIQQRLAQIFRTTALGSDELIRKLQELGVEVQKRKGDLNALAKEAAGYNEVAQRGGPILGTAEASKEATANIEEQKRQLAQIQNSMINIRKIWTGQAAGEGGGGFFGFDIGEGLDAQQEAQLAGALQESIGGALRMAIEGINREDVPELGKLIGTGVGAAIGAYFGDPQTGAQIGAVVGELLGVITMGIGKDKPGTQQRKAIDGYFAELFDQGRLTVVIQGQLTGAIDEATGEAIRSSKPQLARISDLVFEGMTPFAGGVSFGGEGFTTYFQTLSSDVQAAFNGIGLAFGQLNGIASEQAKLIGIALANNIGGSLQNLQVLIQSTGESFDDLAEAVLKSFLDAQISIEEAYNSLVQLQNLYGVGIPGAVGAYKEAIDNLNTSLESNAPGRYAIDSLRDIGAEGLEAKKTFDSVISSLGQTFAFTAQQQTQLFEALRINGITSLQQLQNASDEQLLAILRNIQIIRENATAPLVTTPTTQIENKPAPRTGGAPKKSPEQIALEKLREETKKLLRDSIEYENILKKITSGELSRAAAGVEIIKLQTEIQNALKRRTDLETALEKELDKGRKANKKRLADLAAELDTVNEKIEGFKKKAEETTRVFKELDLKGVIPFIKDANNLGVIMKQVGVSFEKASDILVKGFLQGRLSLAELRAELDKTKETLGPGIPNAVGAVTDAFQNLIDAGTQGGQFSVDAFTDIFAEFREKFQKEGSALREAERKQLNENLRIAREALIGAVGPEATEKARKTLEQAKKTLDDFNASVAAPDLADLRNQLQAAFGPEEVDKFFRALDESGLKTFEDFEKAGTDSVVGILTKLQELGFNFGQTSQDIIDAQTKLQEAEKEANAGLDPMQEAINLIKGLNEGAAQLPPVFNATTQAIESLNGPLGSLASGFDDIIEKVAKLQGQRFENDVVFNISTTGDSTGKALVDILFGNGEGTTQDVPSTTSGNPPAGDSAPTSKKDKWVRMGPGLYKNTRTGKTVKSKTNPGRR